MKHLFIKIKLYQEEMFVTDEKGPISAKRCTVSCTVHLRFWQDLEWEQVVQLSYCQFPLDGAFHPCLTGWQVFPSPLCLAAAGKGEGSPCLCRVSPDPGCCSPDETSKQPPSLLPSRTLLKEFALCSYIAADCTTAGFDG